MAPPIIVLDKELCHWSADIHAHGFITDSKRVNERFLTKIKSPDSEAVDVVAEDHGIIEPVEKVVGPKNRYSVVGCAIMPLPGFTIFGWKDCLGVFQVKTEEDIIGFG